MVKNQKDQAKLAYLNNQSLIDSKYFLSPLLIVAVPYILTAKYQLLLQLTLGASSPYLILGVAFYAAMKRYQWLTSGSKITGACIAKSVKIIDNSTIEIETMSLFKKCVKRVDLRRSHIQLVETDARRESYYVIKSYDNQSLYVLPISEKAIVDHKLLNWINKTRNTPNEEYDIRPLLTSEKQKLIEINKNNNMLNEIETLARIKIYTEKNQGSDLSNASSFEISKLLGQISDKEVQDYVSNLRGDNTGKLLQSIESSLVEIENFFVSLNLNREDAVNLTKLLKNKFKVSNVQEIRNLNNQELATLFDSLANKNATSLNDFKRNIRSFFDSINK